MRIYLILDKKYINDVHLKHVRDQQRYPHASHVNLHGHHVHDLIRVHRHHDHHANHFFRDVHSVTEKVMSRSHEAKQEK